MSFSRKHAVALFLVSGFVSLATPVLAHATIPVVEVEIAPPDQTKLAAAKDFDYYTGADWPKGRSPSPWMTAHIRNSRRGSWTSSAITASARPS